MGHLTVVSDQMAGDTATASDTAINAVLARAKRLRDEMTISDGSGARR